MSAVDLIKSFEGLRLKAYRDPVGILTIGYGSTGAHVKPGMVIDEATAEELLRLDLKRFEAAVAATVKPELTQNQFDALVSFSFNVGITAFANSSLVRLLNNYRGKVSPELAQKVAKELLRWNKANGKVLPGLTRRRQAEAALFCRK